MRRFAYRFVYLIVGVQMLLTLVSIGVTGALLAVGAKFETLIMMSRSLALPMTYIGSTIPELVEKFLPSALVLVLKIALLIIFIKRLVAHLREKSFVPPSSFGKTALFFAMGSIAIFSIVLVLTAATATLHLYGVMIIGGLMLSFAQLSNSISFIITEVGDLLPKEETL